MNTKYTKMVIFIAGMAAFASCSTAYKMGQTPDDVYYSPAKPQSEYVAKEDRRDDSYYEANPRSNRYNNQITDPYYSGYDMYRNDRFLRLGIANQYRWNGFNDYLGFDGLYNYNRFNLYSDYTFGSPFNSYSYWNSYYNPYSSFSYGYNPYYGGGIVIGGGSKYPSGSYAPASRPRAFNPAAYSGNTFSNNSRYLNTNTYSNTPNSGSGRYNNTNSRSNNTNSYYNNSNNRANSYRTTTPSSQNSFFNSSNNSSPSRSYAPSGSSSGGSSGGGSSSGGGASRPTRGGN